MANKVSLTLIVVGLLLFVPTFSSLVVSLNESHQKLGFANIEDEDYSPEIASIDSISEFEDRIHDDIVDRDLSGIEIPILVDDYVRHKFYNHFSSMHWYNNWTLSLIDLVVPDYFLMGYMKPDEILRFDQAICNQQAIVFQAVIGNLGFDYGSIRFSGPDFGHFTSGVKVDNQWYYFDSNLEPVYDRTDPAIFKKIILADRQTLTNIYGDRFGDFTVDMVQFSDLNSFPASNGVLAQGISGFFSWYGWTVFLLPGLLVFLYRRRNSRSGKQYVSN